MTLRRYKPLAKLALICCAVLAAGSAVPMVDSLGLAGLYSGRQRDETLLVKSLLEIQRNRLDNALDYIESLLRVNPNFKLAQLIRGDVLLAHSRPITTLGNVSNAHPDAVEGLREEAKVRLDSFLSPPPADRIPSNLVQLQPQQEHAIVVDISKSRLYLFRNDNGVPRYVSDFYVSSGKNGVEKTREGDQKTPLGVYFVNESLPKNTLTDFYGDGAYPLSYPNEWDRRLGNDGHGIWIHGTPSNTYSRPPRASNGCVVLANPDLSALSASLQIGLTPVIITRQIEWLDESQWRAQQERFIQTLENWRQDWANRDTRRYLEHYARDFQTAGGQGYRDWAAQKERINASKKWIKVNLEGISIFSYPGSENLVVITFDQDYRSSNLNNIMRKRQYWKLENSRWKIAYEGAA